MVATGGYLAVAFFGNRDVTSDIDVFIDPHVTDNDRYKNKINKAIWDVAGDNDIPRDWMNEGMADMIPRRHRTEFFLQSVQEGLIAYNGTNLQVYAGSLMFALESKLRCIDRPSQRNTGNDMSDALAILRHLTANSQPFSTEFFQNLDTYGVGLLIRGTAIRTVELHFEATYNKQGIVDYVYDMERQQNGYQDLQGNWVWVEE